MSNASQSINPDEFIVVKPSTLGQIIKSAVDTSVKEAFQNLQGRINSSSDEGEEIPVDLKEGARILNITMPTMYSKVSKREFSSFKKGKKVWVLKSELLAYLKSGRRKSRTDIINQSK